MVPEVALPKNLYLQLDNTAKDNKNQYLMAFCSLLTARHIFKEVVVGFLIVGHTHEDIDAFFGKLSERLRRTDIYVLADLMKAFMDSQALTFIPEFVQEVADFKSYIKGHLHGGNNALTGLGSKHLFKFYVDDEGWPVMKYKNKATDNTWLPAGTSIRMWCDDGKGMPSLPVGDPKHVPYKFMWGEESVNANAKNHEKEVAKALEATTKRVFILKGIEKYIDVWEVGMARNNAYAQAMAGYVDYWKCILQELKKPIPSQPATLIEGFWPTTDWKRCHVTVGIDTTIGEQDRTPEDEEEVDYCGLAKDKPYPMFNPWRDILVGDFVLVRPDNKEDYVWLAIALTIVDRDKTSPLYGQFRVQWWVPSGKGRASKKSLYRDCWTKQWTKGISLAEYIHCGSVVYTERGKRQDQTTHFISPLAAERAIMALDAANTVDMELQ